MIGHSGVPHSTREALLTRRGAVVIGVLTVLGSLGGSAIGAKISADGAATSVTRQVSANQAQARTDFLRTQKQTIFATQIRNYQQWSGGIDSLFIKCRNGESIDKQGFPNSGPHVSEFVALAKARILFDNQTVLIRLISGSTSAVYRDAVRISNDLDKVESVVVGICQGSVGATGGSATYAQGDLVVEDDVTNFVDAGREELTR